MQKRFGGTPLLKPLAQEVTGFDTVLELVMRLQMAGQSLNMPIARLRTAAVDAGSSFRHIGQGGQNEGAHLCHSGNIVTGG